MAKYAHMFCSDVYHKAIRGESVRNTADWALRSYFRRCDLRARIANEDGVGYGAGGRSWHLRDEPPKNRRPCKRCWPEEATDDAAE